MLVPAITYKIRKIIEPISDLHSLSDEQRSELAADIQTSIIPMLFSYEIDPKVIKTISPIIQLAAEKALSEGLNETL
jgi:hypothetical protein